MNALPANWHNYVAALDDTVIAELSRERGIRQEMFRSLRDANLVGLVETGVIAFPVYNSANQIVALQCRSDDRRWFYNPSGETVTPAVYGYLATATIVYVFESNWDAVAFMDRIGVPEGALDFNHYAVVVTRGAENGGSIRGLVAPNAHCYVFVQNDPINPSKVSAAEKWLSDIVVHAGVPVFRVDTPSGFADLNEWTKAGASRDQLIDAINQAEQCLPRQQALNLFLPSNVDVDDGEADDKVGEFPLDALPPYVQSYVHEVARVLRVPLEMVGPTVLGAFSAAIGRNLRGRLLSGFVTPGNLYQLVVAVAGVGKSAVLGEVGKSIREVEKSEIERWKTNVLPGLLAEEAMLKKQINTRTEKLNKSNVCLKNLRELAEKAIREFQARLQEIKSLKQEPRLTVDNVTSEALIKLLKASGEALASWASEACTSMDNVCGRYNRDNSDEGVYLSGYTGEVIRKDRVGTGSIALDEPCLTLLWFTQEDKFQEFIARKRFLEGGLIARFLLVISDAKIEPLPEGYTSIDTQISEGFHGTITNLTQAIRLGDGVVTVDGTNEAREALRLFCNEIVEARNGELSDISALASRYTEWACRLAVVLHAAELGVAATQKEIQVDTVNRAIKLTRYYIAQQQRALAGMRQSRVRKLREKCLEVIAGSLDGISARDLGRELGLKSDEVHELISPLVDAGFIDEDRLKTKGRPKVVYTVNQEGQ